MEENLNKPFELGELVFEPAKENDQLPEGVWIPNRAQRRAMKKNKNKKGYNNPMLESIRSITDTDEFKQKTYQQLADFISKKRQEIIEKEKNDNGAINEGK